MQPAVHKLSHPVEVVITDAVSRAPSSPVRAGQKAQVTGIYDDGIAFEVDDRYKLAATFVRPMDEDDWELVEKELKAILKKRKTFSA